MAHVHYSPFQFATSVQASEGDVMPAKKIIGKLKKMVKVLPMPALMSCNDAHAVLALKSPTAFIAPNQPDTMRMIKSVFGC